MNENEVVYTTSTMIDQGAAVDYNDYYEWCFVCSRPTDHRAEHDDLVETGRAHYDEHNGVVHLVG